MTPPTTPPTTTPQGSAQQARPLTGKVALVTGAARGIGRATAVRLAEEGADVALLDVASRLDHPGTPPVEHLAPASRDDLDETERLVAATGRRGLPLTADVRDYDAVAAATQRAADELGGLDIVVANAGVVAWSAWEDMTKEQWDLVVDVNLTGTFTTLRAATPFLVRRGGGRMVALTSVGGRQGVPGVANYAAARWGVIGLVKTAALELGRHGVTVNAVAPTAVDTPMYRSVGQARSTNPGHPDPGPAEQDAQMLGVHALPVAALQPSDIAAGIAFLCSADARWISGATLDIAAGGNARYTA